jgi:hypothetical protein
MQLIFSLMMLAPADAAEVVWLGNSPPDPALWRQLAVQAGARGDALTIDDLRSAQTMLSPDDDLSYANLDKALKAVRAYETRLDGELLIIDELSVPIGKISIIRNDADKAALFSALAYQGFAVDRYFEDDLAKDDRAKAYRTEVDGLAVVQPWVDAVALDANREVTPYDISEAPQRIDYGKVQVLTKKALPARLVPTGLPQGARLIVDGQPATPGPTGAVNVIPGRHLAHVDWNGHIIARYDVRVKSGEKADLAAPVPIEGFDAWIATLKAGKPGPVPTGLASSIARLGGEIWVAAPDAKGPKVYKVTAAGVEPVVMAAPPSTSKHGVSFAAGIAGGWLSSGEFYTQDPVNVPRSTASVNAATSSLSVNGSYDMGMFRFGGGLDLAATFGKDHVAKYADAQTRFRPYPYASVGIKPLQATAGFVFPGNPTIGLLANIPLVAGLEIRATAWYGFGLDRTRADGTTWDGLPLYAASGGVAWRFGKR